MSTEIRNLVKKNIKCYPAPNSTRYRRYRAPKTDRFKAKIDFWSGRSFSFTVISLHCTTKFELKKIKNVELDDRSKISRKRRVFRIGENEASFTFVEKFCHHHHQ